MKILQPRCWASALVILLCFYKFVVSVVDLAAPERVNGVSTRKLISHATYAAVVKSDAYSLKVRSSIFTAKAITDLAELVRTYVLS